MPVSEAELSTLAASHDILTLGMLADDVRRARHGARTTFVRVADIPCEVAAPVAWPGTPGEVRVVGSPSGLGAAVERIRAVAARSHGVPVSAFSLADLEAVVAREGGTLRRFLEELRAAGLDLVAEAPLDRLRDARRSIEEVNIAGLALARATVDQLQPGEMMEQLKHVAELQRQVGVIRAFAPLPRRVNPELPTTGYDDVKRVALARLLVANVPTIQIEWQLYGPKLAQVALTMGADDLDGVSPEESDEEGRRRAVVATVRRNIEAAGLEPVERNGRFETIDR
jgi:aminodeoxyfutalosine synthase